MEIVRLDHQGRGIGYIDSKIVFVPNALVGEEVDIKITNSKKNYSEGAVLKYIKESNRRVKPACPYYGVCGGCDLMHMSYEEQLNFKQSKVENILKRKVNKIVPSNQFNYRNKVTLKYDGKLGYYEENTHNVVPINSCLLLNDKINNIITYLNQTKLENNKEIIIRSNNDKTMLVLADEIKLDYPVDSVYINGTLEKGLPHLNESLGKFNFAISPKSFFQVNTKQALNLYNKVLEYGCFKGNERVLDLYCGTGTIGIFISKNVKEVVGVEINESSIIDATINKELNNITNIEFIHSDVSKINVSNFNSIIVDPPRSGLDKITLGKLNNSKSEKIIYVSCDPITLKRDLDLLNNYTVLEITPFDMFPNTHHVETVVLLLNKEGDFDE